MNKNNKNFYDKILSKKNQTNNTNKKIKTNNTDNKIKKKEIKKNNNNNNNSINNLNKHFSFLENSNNNNNQFNEVQDSEIRMNNNPNISFDFSRFSSPEELEIEFKDKIPELLKNIGIKGCGSNLQQAIRLFDSRDVGAVYEYTFDDSHNIIKTSTDVKTLDAEVEQQYDINDDEDCLELIHLLLPETVADYIIENIPNRQISEIIKDKGKDPYVLFIDGGYQTIEYFDIEEMVDFVFDQCDEFTPNNRAGISGSLHRISKIDNRDQKIIGLTTRIGRHIGNISSPLHDIIYTMHTNDIQKSLLVLGGPSKGKTTLLRDIARVLSTDLNKRVIIVDTSGDITGCGDIAHSSIGRARRLPVYSKKDQSRVILEAVQNHNPQVIIVDEIGSRADVESIEYVISMGITLIGSAHGTCVASLLKNKNLNKLVGGIKETLISDFAAKQRENKKKFQLERKNSSLFDVVVEIKNYQDYIVYKNAQNTVDEILLKIEPIVERRVKKQEKHFLQTFYDDRTFEL
eukprot:TRINITY_DN3852_c1_g1_i1.p1 TRINITY_DN3852_c1_g1~~TRINITY_DN3852_c1_g1_i1.p1  ORF type:complete len:516 (+),score=157.94 TRINITY_DN3852_c1_g1_i1:66-1613(+)